MEPRQIIDIIVDVIIGSYGNLGYTDFKIHSIEPNSQENIFIVKYSFVPRSSERKRIFYETKIDVKNKSNFASKEINENEL